MPDRKRTVLAAVLAAVLTVALLAACGRDSVPDVDDDLLADLAEELGIRECQRRLDSLAFRMEGILFDADVDITDREAVLALVPVPLPVCPVTGDTFLVRDEGYVVVFSCPNGHGSVEVR